MKATSKLVRFVCNKGFMLIGTKYSGCLNGYFDQNPPICVNNRPNCKKINDINNGLTIPEGNDVVVHFFCKPEFKLIGSNKTICDGNEWIYGLPTCLPNNSTEPETSCDFERDDICGWSHDLNHDFDWKRTNLETPTRETGPRFDHTKGYLKNGHYMYVESTSRVENDTSRLISPIFSKKSQICVRFFYHMYGKDMGTLNVYVKGLNENFRKLGPLFSVSGNQGDFWNLGQFSTEAKEQFQVIFEGLRGKSYFSDIAIDDVSITDDECPEETTETPNYSTETEEIPTFDSCLNRCGQNDTNLNNLTTCSCDENCFELNLCCADFIQYCFLGTSVDYEDVAEISTTEMITETTEETETTTMNEISTKPTKQTIKTTVEPIEFTTKTFPIFTLPQRTIPKKPKIITKSTSTTTTTSSTTTTIRPSTIPQDLEDETAIKIETDFVATTREPNVQYLQQNNKKTETKPNNIVVYFAIVGSVAFVTIVVVITVIVVKRNDLNCKKFQNSRNNDSMSDVRFLASDEVLDFTWKRAEDL